MSAARVVGAGLAVVMTVAIASLSRAPRDFAPDHAALLRLSWRVDGVSVEACRTLSEEELARLPVHMRNPQACIGTIAPFELRAVLDDETLLVDTLEPGGARGDRPIYVLHDMPVAPGTSDVSVTFRALIPEGADIGEGRTEYAWDGTVDVEAGDVALLTLTDAGELVLRTPRNGDPRGTR